MPRDLAMAFSSLLCLRLDSSLRGQVSELLVSGSKLKVSLCCLFPIPRIYSDQDVLYALLLCGDKVITLVRPKKHSIHPLGESLLHGLDVCFDNEL